MPSKKIALIFPKDSEAIFNIKSQDTFGGATVQIYLLARELNNHKEISVYSLINDYSNINFPEIDRFNLIKTFRKNDNLVKKIITFHNSIKQIKPDIIIQRGLTSFSCMLAVYCRINRIKYIFMFAHDNEIDGRYQRTNKRCLLYNLLLKYSSFMIFQSQYKLNRINKKYFHKSRIIYSGYEIGDISITKRENILWVSRLEEWKRPETFLKLAEVNPEKNFFMIAPESPGNKDLFNYIIDKIKYIENLQYLKFVQFHEIDKYFQKAKIFVNTSIQEGFPNTFIQACKNGTPIISLNVNPDNFLGRYSCGFYCEDDFDLMNENLNRILNDDKLYDSISLNAYNYALKNHDIKKNARRLLEIIE